MGQRGNIEEQTGSKEHIKVTEATEDHLRGITATEQARCQPAPGVQPWVSGLYCLIAGDTRPMLAAAGASCSKGSQACEQDWGPMDQLPACHALRGAPEC